ncbi:hypothetical protein [Streptomyces sp. NPDC048612]|uniref:hypothetical protein n=1 Tax=Streptomyces sp. NPDC048612 TaxID=3365579 RepID=UPI0037144E79
MVELDLATGELRFSEGECAAGERVRRRQTWPVVNSGLSRKVGTLLNRVRMKRTAPPVTCAFEKER